MILGVAGGSGSGKSTVVRELVRSVGDDVASVMRHDWYYRDLAHLPIEQRSSVNFDHPDAIAWDELTEKLRTTIAKLNKAQPLRKDRAAIKTTVSDFYDIKGE